jgi:nitrite reductase (NADH) small subunit/3-phenylpropionate/trans-cinnamate dioxygenase ferredoxin subunit
MSDTPEFVTVARVGDVQEGRGRAFNVGGRTVAVFLHQGEYYAIDDFCPHMGASLAGGGIYKNAVACPWHAWRFSLRDGCWLDNPKLKIDTFPIRVENDEIQVHVPPRTDTRLPGGKK